MLRIAYEGDLTGLDPHRSIDDESTSVMKYIFEGLYDFDHAGHLVPRVARTLPEVSHDGKTVRVVLRDDIRFAHGPLLTSADVVASFRRLLAPATASPSADVFYLLEGAADYRSGRSTELASVVADGANAVVFRLRAPDQTFQSLLAMMAAAPLPADLYRPGVAPTRPSGTGAYVVESWERGSRMLRRAHVNRFDDRSPVLGESAPRRIVAELKTRTCVFAVSARRSGYRTHVAGIRRCVCRSASTAAGDADAAAHV